MALHLCASAGKKTGNFHIKTIAGHIDWLHWPILIIIIEGLSLLQSIPPTTANKQTQAQKRRGSRARKLLGAKAKSYRLKN